MKTLTEPEVQTLIRRIRALKPDAARRWGKMTAHQAVCHLNDSFLGVMGGRSVSPAGGLARRTIVKWAALYLPARWPQGVPTRPEVDQHIGGTPPAEWEGDCAALVASLVQFSKLESNPNAHPIFGRLTRKQWMRWGYLHVDHHLRQFGA